VAPTKDLSPDPGPTDVSAVLGLTVAGGALPVNNRAGIARYSNAAVDRAARLPQKLRPVVGDRAAERRWPELRLGEPAAT
jgi:hypothetical protein